MANKWIGSVIGKSWKIRRSPKRETCSGSKGTPGMALWRPAMWWPA